MAASRGRLNTPRLPPHQPQLTTSPPSLGFGSAAISPGVGELGLYPDAATEKAAAAERSRDRRLLLQALVVEGLLVPEDLGRFLSEAGEPTYSPDLGNAIQCFLARSRARLMLVQLEDVVGETEQANLPGTIDGHPNWRRRLSRTLENIIDGSKLRRTASFVEEARRRSTQA